MTSELSLELIHNAFDHNILTLLGVKKNFNNNFLANREFSNQCWSFLEALPNQILNKIVNYNVFEDNVDKHVRNKDKLGNILFKALETKDKILLKSTLSKMKHNVFDGIILNATHQIRLSSTCGEILKEHINKMLNERKYLDFPEAKKRSWGR